MAGMLFVVESLYRIETLGPQRTALGRHAPIVIALSPSAALAEQPVGDRYHLAFAQEEMPKRNRAMGAADHGGIAAHT